MCLAAIEDRASPTRLRQATLTELTRVFEELILEFDTPGALLAGFQDDGQWRQARERYGLLARSPDRGVAVASSADLAPGDGVQHLPLGTSHPLAGHWFLIARTPMVSATLVAKEVPGEPGDHGSERPFEAVWTFDPSIAMDVHNVLVDLTAGEAPDFDRFITEVFPVTPARAMDHRFGQRYSVMSFERLEASRRRWRDLSVELEMARRELEERAERQLKLERLASVGTLAASVAHDLNNPLTSITMAASVMEQLQDPEERVRMAGIIETEALRAGRIAGDLLSFVADRDLELTSTRLDLWLADLATDCLSSGKPVAFAPAPQVTVDVDRDRLRQALTNLVDNALDAIDQDGRIEIELATAGSGIEITVTDDGGGIPEHVRSRLFEPFTTTKPRAKGTGLGLPIARAHLQDHGGSLRLVHTGPEGTRFLIELPEKRITATNDGADDAPAAPLVQPPEHSGSRVLVVDDEPSIRALLETLLSRSGWRVVSASGLHEAVRAAQTEPIDIALIDVQLGIHDGPTILAKLEEVQPGLRQRSAYVTGAPPASGEVDGRPVLPKPFRWEDLSTLLERLHGSAP